MAENRGIGATAPPVKDVALLTKPQFAPGGAGFNWDEAEPFPDELRRHLVQLVIDDGKAPESAAAAFVSSVEGWAHDLLSSASGQALADQRAALALVSDRAHATLVAINALSSEGRQSVDSRAAAVRHTTGAALASGAQAAMDATGGLLSGAWDLLATLQQHAARAAAALAEHTARNPRYRSAEAAGEGLSYFAASEFHAAFGRWPPLSQQSWFVEFMQGVGAHVGAECGPRIVARAVRKARADLPTDTLDP